MDIDKLFKVPKLPAGHKRKLPDNPTPEMLKKMRFDAETTTEQTGNAKGKSRAVTVEEVVDEDAMDQGFAPGGDADYFAEEDDEGRFFGGGLTTEQKEILNIFDKSGGEGAVLDSDDLSSTSLRRILLRFERAVNKNQDQRSKYPDDPTKFIDSEADLDGAIKALLPLAQAPALAYPDLIRSNIVNMLIGLLSHENPDIVIDVVEVIHELTDEDVGNNGDEGGDQEAAEEALRSLVENFVGLSLLELLVDNLSRLNEEEESDRQGVFHVLGIFENVLGFDPTLSTAFVTKTKILSWLLERIQGKTHNENRGYAAEVLSILLQDNKQNRLALGEHDGVEAILKVLSQYRKRDPVDSDETEFMENIFDALCSALNENSIKELFLKAEGPDLMVLMMKEKLQSRSRCIKTLDYAMSGPSSFEICNAFVEALGLKTLFSIFMGKGTKKSKTAPTASEDTSHILGIIASLFSRLGPDSPGRIRLLAKFVENDYEKVDKLLEIRDNAASLLKKAEKEIADERKQAGQSGESITSEEEDMWYLRRLDGGLFTLQIVDYILAWIILEDDGIRSHALQLMARKNLTTKNIIETLQVYHDNMDDTEPMPTEDDRPPTQKEILESLIAMFKGEGQT